VTYSWKRERTEFFNPDLFPGRKFYFAWTFHLHGWKATIDAGSGNAGKQCFVWTVYDNKGRQRARGSHKRCRVARDIAASVLRICRKADGWP
jgi:hypothetical protein